MSTLSFLIADPSKALQTFMQQLLEGYGFSPDGIQTVSTVEAALEASQNDAPDFLLTDS